MESTTRLYSVDSEGEAQAAAPTGPTGTKGDPPKRSKSKPRPKYPVPTDRMKFETAIESLVAACAASSGGKDNVTAETQASFMSVSEATAGLNNAFFCSVGLMNKVGKGEYEPTDLAHEFQRKWSFDKATAPTILRPAFEGTWFHEAVQQRVQVGSPTRDQMIETLASVAGTDASYSVQYGFLLDWLEWVGLIRVADGIVSLTTLDTSTKDDKVSEDSEDEREADETDETTAHLGDGRNPSPVESTPVIAVSFDMRLTAEDLAELPSETIADLFDGVGKIAAVKAALKD